MSNVISVILGGGRGNLLFPLKQYRSIPAVPIGGNYRLVHIPIGNCIHQDVDKILALSQLNSASLNRDVFATYRFGCFSDGFVNILADEQTTEDLHIREGTIVVSKDAVIAGGTRV